MSSTEFQEFLEPQGPRPTYKSTAQGPIIMFWPDGLLFLRMLTGAILILAAVVLFSGTAIAASTGYRGLRLIGTFEVGIGLMGQGSVILLLSGVGLMIWGVVATILGPYHSIIVRKPVQNWDATYAMPCPKCGCQINPVTREGVNSPENEPWVLICNACQSRIEPRL